jgi:hypothetical protein
MGEEVSIKLLLGSGADARQLPRIKLPRIV